MSNPKVPDSATDQLQGAMHELKGGVKQKVGKLIGNPDLETEGQAEKVGGTVQRKVGEIEKVIGK